MSRPPPMSYADNPIKQDSSSRRMSNSMSRSEAYRRGTSLFSLPEVHLLLHPIRGLLPAFL